MPKKTPHPSTDQLSAFTHGQLPPEIAQEVEDHISKCDPCCETLLAIGSDEDTFVELLQEAGGTKTSALETDDDPTTTADDEIPKPLLNHARYEIAQLVGRGGMGRVFKARHRMMDRAVALKVIHHEWVRRQEAIDRFRREVKTAASLDHPNIVTAHDAEQADDLHLLVMEYVDGVDLSETVKQRGPLSVSQACDYIRQAAEGLQYAHDRGMVHRDIKPHNLMVTRDNVVKILDFGLASLAPQATPDEPISEDSHGNLTIAGSIMGTPDYISPEQAQDARQVDGRSDIYSLGMTLYYLLAGRVPFGEGNALQKLKQHGESEPTPLTQFRDDVPQELQDIIARMTAKDPAERFQSPREVADALQGFCGEPPESSPVRTSGGNWRASLLLFVGLLLAGITGFFLYGFGHLFRFRVATERDVHASASELESYIAAMAASPHNLVFMNVYDIGPDENSLTFKTTNNGLTMNVSAPVTSHDTKRRGKYVYRMKDLADDLSVPVTEKASIAQDGTVTGIKFTFTFTGHAQVVASNVQQIVTRTFDVGAGDEFMYQCRNFPSHISHAEAESARLVSSQEFVAEYDRGSRVFLGEIEQHIFLIPNERKQESPLRMDEEVWYTDVRDLPPGIASQIRMESAVGAQPIADTNATMPGLRMINNGSAGTKLGDTTVHSWNLAGRDVGEMTIKLLSVQNGKASVVRQFHVEDLGAECTSDIRLVISDETREDDQHTLNATLDVKVDAQAVQPKGNPSEALPITVKAPFSVNRSPNGLPELRADRTEFLFAKSYWDGNLSYRDSIDAMISATKEGKAAFLLVTVDWTLAD